MKPHEFVGWTLLNTTAVTAITSTRISHGMRPQASGYKTLPAINFYEVSGGRNNGLGNKTFSINCRAENAEDAIALKEEVIDIFQGTAGTGMMGTNNGFSAFTSLDIDQGIIEEPEGPSYNAPLSILVVYTQDVVS